MHCANVVELLLTSGFRTLLLSRREFLGEGVFEKLYLTVGPLTTGVFIHTFVYENILYKNIEAEKRQKFKNILRIY